MTLPTRPGASPPTQQFGKESEQSAALCPRARGLSAFLSVVATNQSPSRAAAYVNFGAGSKKYSFCRPRRRRPKTESSMSEGYQIYAKFYREGVTLRQALSRSARARFRRPRPSAWLPSCLRPEGGKVQKVRFGGRPLLETIMPGGDAAPRQRAVSAPATFSFAPISFAARGR